MQIIIFGTGPSVNSFDFSKISCDTLGLNQFFLKNYPTTYYYVYDKMCLYRENPNFTSVIDSWKDTIFYIDKKIKLPDKFRKNSNIVKTTSKSITLEELNNKDNWARNLSQPLYINKSALTGAINLAYILGYKEIYLVGIDGFGGYFYNHKSNKFKHRLHESLIHYPGFGTLAKSLEIIIKWLEEENIYIYNTNKNSFFVKNQIMKFKRY